MNLPPLILGLSLLLWGWQTHFIWVALPLAILFEAAPYSRLRWEFSTTDYQRIWNGCLVMLLASVVFAVGYSNTLRETSVPASTGDRGYTETLPLATLWALLFFQWQPLVFAPFIAAVTFGGQPKLPITVFSWWARRQDRPISQSRAPIPVREISVPPLYLALVLVASSTSNRRSWLFIVGFWVLVGIALWPKRSKRMPAWGWLTTFALVGGLGFFGQIGLNQLQKLLMNLDSSWLQRFVQNRTNPLESRTRIGTIGDLKLSGRIVLRLQETNDSPAELLREASYDNYNLSTWSVASKGESISGKLDWRDASQEDVATSWSLAKDRRNTANSSLGIAMYVRGGRAMLPIPHGTIELHDVPGIVRKNNYGGVQILEGPGLLNYQAIYGPLSTIDRSPTDKDRQIPDSEREAVTLIAEQLKLKQLSGLSMTETLRTLRSFFLSNFRYSTFQDTPHKDLHANKSPLTHFLTWQRAGHCEFFATATVLILRAADIPARYAVGYSVQESSGYGRFVVRERHAHAWCLVWSEERQSWDDFDTTPPGWNQVESENASFWEPLSDFGSRLWFEYSEWRAGRSELTKYMVYALTGLLLLFVTRLFLTTQRKQRSRESQKGAANFASRGLDSDFYRVEQALKTRGLVRQSDETATQLLHRAASATGLGLESLLEMLALHYRHRFDPDGLSQTERAQLKRSADRSIETLRVP